jgi:hypothetical protein
MVGQVKAFLILRHIHYNRKFRAVYTIARREIVAASYSGWSSKSTLIKWSLANWVVFRDVEILESQPLSHSPATSSITYFRGLCTP